MIQYISIFFRNFTEKYEETMEVDEYRSKILDLLLNAKDGDGAPRLTEKEAKDLSNEFTDQELSDGMPFNTPEEVAEMLLESGL